MKAFFFLALMITNTVYAANPTVIIKMKNMGGQIEIELNQEKAPLTVANFLKYVDDKFYDGTIFHRVISDFMIQGGGFTKPAKKLEEKKSRPSIQNEATNGLKNETATIAMARTPEPHSASSQFFINVRDNTSLDHTSPTKDGFGYAVFGKVTSGMDLVKRIKMVRTGSLDGHENVPMDTVEIESITRK